MANHLSEVTKLSHLVWVLDELLAHAEKLRDEDRCLGDLKRRHLSFESQKVTRAPVNTVSAIYDRLLQLKHERLRSTRLGHDRGCLLLGVSERTMLSVIREAKHVRGRVLLEEAVAAGIHEAALAVEGRIIALEQWQHVNGRRTGASYVRDALYAVVAPQVLQLPAKTKVPRPLARSGHLRRRVRFG